MDYEKPPTKAPAAAASLPTTGAAKAQIPRPTPPALATRQSPHQPWRARPPGYCPPPSATAAGARPETPSPISGPDRRACLQRGPIPQNPPPPPPPSAAAPSCPPPTAPSAPPPRHPPPSSANPETKKD